MFNRKNKKMTDIKIMKMGKHEKIGTIIALIGYLIVVAYMVYYSITVGTLFFVGYIITSAIYWLVAAMIILVIFVPLDNQQKN